VKYLKKLNESKDGVNPMNSKDLDEEILYICMPLTDRGYSLEALHQSGYVTYNIFTQNSFFFYTNYKNDLKSIGNKTNKEKFFEDFQLYTKYLSIISDEFPEVFDRICSMKGINDFMFMGCGIQFSFNYSGGYIKRANPIMLAGDAPSNYRS